MDALVVANADFEEAVAARRERLNDAVRRAISKTLSATGTDNSGLAAAMGTSSALVSAVLAGTRPVSASFLTRFCEAVQVPEAEILAGTWNCEGEESADGQTVGR